MEWYEKIYLCCTVLPVELDDRTLLFQVMEVVFVVSKTDPSKPHKGIFHDFICVA